MPILQICFHPLLKCFDDFPPPQVDGYLTHGLCACAMDALPELCRQLSPPMRTFFKKKFKKLAAKTIWPQITDVQFHQRPSAKLGGGGAECGCSATAAAASLLISSQRCVKIRRDRLRQLRD